MQKRLLSALNDLKYISKQLKQLGFFINRLNSNIKYLLL